MSCCSIVPPYILRALAASDDPDVAAGARASLRQAEEQHRLRHEGRPSSGPGHRRGSVTTEGTAAADRTVADAHGTKRLPGTTVRREGEAATGDVAADEAYEGLGATWHLWWDVFGRNSLDGKGLPLLASVHYSKAYDNAFWDGTQMVFGDGDGVIFGRFTASLDVIGHELAHGVTEHTAGLLYDGQSGALNESMSDVFGVLVKQHELGHRADEADWLIGAELLLPGVRGRALRDMRQPGTAYDDPRLGKDPQPDSMAGYVDTTDDHGGVHINSGIPNRAFVLAALELGGFAWQTVGPIWYAALTGPAIAADCDFATFADLTVVAAVAAHGDSSPEAKAVRSAWQTVGVLGSGAAGSGDQNPSGEAYGDVPAADASVMVRRTGGFAGLTKEAHVRLSELPDSDTSAWETLLASPTLQRLGAERLASAGSQVRDGYCYSIVSPEHDVDVTVDEPDLPDHIQSLLDRTLRLG